MSTGPHGHVWDEGGVTCVEIAADVCLTPIRAADPSRPHDEGYWFCHDVPGAERRCTGRVLTVNSQGGPVWEQTGTLDDGDLTLSPSVLCSAARYGETDHPECHGWVRDGKWVRA